VGRQCKGQRARGATSEQAASSARTECVDVAGGAQLAQPQELGRHVGHLGRGGHVGCMWGGVHVGRGWGEGGMGCCASTTAAACSPQPYATVKPKPSKPNQTSPLTVPTVRVDLCVCPTFSILLKPKSCPFSERVSKCHVCERVRAAVTVVIRRGGSSKNGRRQLKARAG